MWIYTLCWKGSCLSSKVGALHEAAKANLGVQLQLFASSLARMITRLVVPRQTKGIQLARKRLTPLVISSHRILSPPVVTQIFSSFSRRPVVSMQVPVGNISNLLLQCQICQEPSVDAAFHAFHLANFSTQDRKHLVKVFNVLEIFEH